MKMGQQKIALLGVGASLPFPLFAATDNELLEEINRDLEAILVELSSLRSEAIVANQGFYDGFILSLLCLFLFDLLYRAILER